MNCPNCNANLADSASFCYSCGSSIRSNTFSYLPEGTPPWPSNERMASYSSHVGAGLAPPQAAQAPSSEMSRPVETSPVRPKRRARNILVALAVLALSILLGVGTSLAVLWSNGYIFTSTPNKPVHVPPVGVRPTAPATTTTGNMLPAPTAFSTIRSTDLGISMKYPSDWAKMGPQQASPDNMIVDFSQQQFGIDFLIRRISGSTSARLNSATDANQAILVAFSNVPQVHNLQVTGASQRMIGGVRWDEQDATFTSDTGDTFRFVTIAVSHNKLYYIISFLAPNVVYNEAIAKYIQPMLDSFQFLT